MPAYRIFAISEDDDIVGPPASAICESDQEAVRKAEELKSNYDIEVWDGNRLIACVESEPKRRRLARSAARAVHADLNLQPSELPNVSPSIHSIVGPYSSGDTEGDTEIL
jgi:hypothetical protein